MIRNPNQLVKLHRALCQMSIDTRDFDKAYNAMSKVQESIDNLFEIFRDILEDDELELSKRERESLIKAIKEDMALEIDVENKLYALS